MVCVGDSVTPYFSVASTVCEAIIANSEVVKRAQSLRDEFLTKAADILEWATSPGIGSRKKFMVAAMRTMDLS